MVSGGSAPQPILEQARHQARGTKARLQEPQSAFYMVGGAEPKRARHLAARVFLKLNRGDGKAFLRPKRLGPDEAGRFPKP